MKKLLIVLTIITCANQMAYSDECDAQPERHWVRPQSYQIFKPGDVVSMYRCGKSLDRKVEVWIYQTSGTKNFGKDVITAEEYLSNSNEEFYNGCNGLPVLYKDFTLPCDRSGLFKIKVTTHKKKGSCGITHESDEERYFIVETSTDISPISKTYLACPNKPYTITIPRTVEQVNETFDDVRWYEDATSPNHIHQGFEHTKTYQSGDIIDYWLTYVKRNRGCEIESNVRFPSTVIGLDLTDLVPPAPQFKTYCEKGTYDLHVANPNDYDGVLWYSEYDNPVPIHDGFTYTKECNKFNEMIYVEYYQHNGDECTRKSVRTPIHITVFPEIFVYATDGVPLLSNIEIYDHRDVSRDCFDDPQFYHDLRDGLDLSDYEQTANTWGTFISNVINNTSPFTDFEITDVGNYRWEPNQVGEDYFQEGPELRVCSDNITTQQGQYSAKEYTLNADVSYIISTYDHEGTKIYTESRTCEYKGLRRKRIRNKPPGTTSFTEKCNPPTVELAEALVNEANPQSQPCASSEVVQACPEETYVIGPGTEYDNIPLTTYRWSPSTGLSDPNIKNPSIAYNNIPGSSNQIVKYTLTISAPAFINGSQKHCTYLYKCPSCGTIDDASDPLNDPIGVGGL